MNLAELGEEFKRARIRVNKTQQEVADQSGVPRARISLFETGALPELGFVKLLSLFEAVGLELLTRPLGHRRTLDDVLAEAAEEQALANLMRTRVRHPRSRPAPVDETDRLPPARESSTSRGRKDSK
jgi:transcriptional regulator with XRE-family HTH domain